MNNKILSLSILDNSNKTIFDKNKYIIPLYQRAFAWSDKEICQLIDDINDFTAEHYYLGSLIVNLNKDGIYEVIDGQQRLTALFLLLDYLGDYNWGKDRLSYECRERSNYTLNCLAELKNDKIESYLANAEKIEQSLVSGRKIIDDKFRNDKINVDRFITNLKKVILYRIKVPPHTDLNRYFEIMNVRGEQLEQHDILKAKLMEPLDEQSRIAFAIVWDACRDMTGYVQMHFQKEQRDLLFGSHWDGLDFNKVRNLCNKKDTKASSRSVLDIIKSKIVPASTDGEDEMDTHIRFDSIIGFTHFLLHVLKVFASVKLDKDSYSIPELLDDKKLLDVFTSVIDNGTKNGKSISKKYFSLAFIKCLLKCRFLFDKYFIKREYKNDNSNGEWSLKELKENSKKPQYNNTEFKDKGEWDSTYQRVKVNRHSQNLMLQSCLRVSYTSPKIMHWITELLKWLYKDNNLQKLSQFQNFTEDIAKENAIAFLQDNTNYRQGVNTPHIVLNYLDYLLWTERDNAKYKKLDFAQFSFEFRNSVEHWYPQHPYSDDNKTWEEIDSATTYDRFGNLCLLQRNVNSKFSNASPLSKKGYETQISKGSLKLRIMSKKTTDNSKWITEDCAKHEEEMLKLLRSACEQ